MGSDRILAGAGAVGIVVEVTTATAEAGFATGVADTSVLTKG
jgi:hypothetical protein